VFFFDEAHLLFADAPKALLDKVEQVVRLVRSKGVGVFFVTQNPLDIPDTVLGQLGNPRAARAAPFTPREQKAVRVASPRRCARTRDCRSSRSSASSRRRALVSLLDEQGAPGVTERRARDPARQPRRRAHRRRAGEADRRVAAAGHYEQAIDRESAYERLKARVETPAPSAAPARAAPERPRRPDSTRRNKASSAVSHRHLLFGRRGPRGGVSRKGSSRRSRRAPRVLSDRRRGARADAAVCSASLLGAAAAGGADLSRAQPGRARHVPQLAQQRAEAGLSGLSSSSRTKTPSSSTVIAGRRLLELRRPVPRRRCLPDTPSSSVT
jgi:hypothetical protein